MSIGHTSAGHAMTGRLGIGHTSAGHAMTGKLGIGRTAAGHAIDYTHTQKIMYTLVTLLSNGGLL
jgi:hypothetical protein